MDAIIRWFEAHNGLSGWAQFFGAMFTLIVTYFTVFAPGWRRQRQLKEAAGRLLQHGYEAVESYHRTSANYIAYAINLRFAAVTMTLMGGEISRFPIYELNDQGSRSLARRLLAMLTILQGLHLFFEEYAGRLGDEPASEEDRTFIRSFVGDRMQAALDLVAGRDLAPVVWTQSEPQDS